MCFFRIKEGIQIRSKGGSINSIPKRDKLKRTCYNFGSKMKICCKISERSRFRSNAFRNKFESQTMSLPTECTGENLYFFKDLGVQIP